MDFEGKVAIVTGAANGIGRATAIRFAQRGARVVLADIDSAGLKQTQEVIGVAAVAQVTDVADYDACQAMVKVALDHFGRIDVLFNNAGISGVRGLIGEQSPETWRRVIDVNLNGVFYCTRAAIPTLLELGGGVIINTASVDGLIGMATVSHYTAAKHGVIGLTKACALEYGRRNIRCVAVAPGLIHTAMTEHALSDEERAAVSALIPLGRGARPEEVAGLVTWLASEEASYMNGSFHTVDGGLTAGIPMPG